MTPGEMAARLYVAGPDAIEEALLTERARAHAEGLEAGRGAREAEVADQERRLGMLRALLTAGRHEIEYLRGQVRALNGALGR